MDDWYFLEIDKAHYAREKKKAQELKRSQWWKNQLAKGICHYCGRKFPPKDLTMDHVVPIARGGRSTKGNVVVSCQACNRQKKLATPAEIALKQATDKPEPHEN